MAFKDAMEAYDRDGADNYESNRPDYDLDQHRVVECFVDFFLLHRFLHLLVVHQPLRDACRGCRRRGVGIKFDLGAVAEIGAVWRHSALVARDLEGEA